MSKGIKLISDERARQVSDEDWTPEHDDEHTDGSLAAAAVCYAAPERLFREERRFVNKVTYEDPWPWEGKWDKRYRYRSCRDNSGNRLPDPGTYNAEERIDLLTKADALIAAEIDRLLRQQE